jgi:histidyl-tRNA synthetase
MPKKTKTAKPLKKKFVPREKVAKATTAGKAAAPEVKSGKKTFSVLRGMHDILPREEKYWRTFRRTAEHLADFYQFGLIETPVLEEMSLFVRSIGKGTDVVEKEIYSFEDRDGSKVCLRPEATASIVRAYIGNGMWNQQQPAKMWYWGPMFRHDRPQNGRYRQFFQVGYETIGIKDPAADAEMILLAYSFYNDIGLPTVIHINSLGTPEERVRYINELVSYYRNKRSYLCEDCRNRISKNPLRLLDCKEESCQKVKEAAPQILDWLEEDSKNYFMKVLEYLEELHIPYVLTPTLVRGLDYYTHTVFEIYPAFEEEKNEAGAVINQGSQSALGGGGRYDLLVEELGGKPTPACGMALGLERAVAALRRHAEANKVVVKDIKYEVFFAQLGDDAKRLALRMINELRGTGIQLAFNFFKNSLKTQLELANSLQVPYVVILGQKEVQDKTVIIRDMESGVQEIVDQKKIESILKKKLGKNN